jgi:hypothetical protein
VVHGEGLSIRLIAPEVLPVFTGLQAFLLTHTTPIVGGNIGFANGGRSGNVTSMSAVELAVRKVKKLSARQARELLGWLTARQRNGAKQTSRTSRRKTTARRSMQKLKAWQDSVRGTTNWTPPRMPDDLVKPVRL